MADQILCEWDGEVMRPSGSVWARRADKLFTVGERYMIGADQERSANSHRHYLSAVREAWENLPESLAERFPSESHLRKYALIKTGFHDERSIVCASKAEAQRVAAFIRPMDDYALVTVSEAVVRVYTARSQSMKAMGKDDFQKSKQAVLDLVSDMIGVTRTQLEKATA